jgi:hypothetical protein
LCCIRDGKERTKDTSLQQEAGEVKIKVGHKVLLSDESVRRSRSRKLSVHFLDVVYIVDC